LVRKRGGPIYILPILDTTWGAEKTELQHSELSAIHINQSTKFVQCPYKIWTAVLNNVKKYKREAVVTTTVKTVEAK